MQMGILAYGFKAILVMSAAGTAVWLVLRALTPLLQRHAGAQAAYYARAAVLCCLLIPGLLLTLPGKIAQPEQSASGTAQGSAAPSEGVPFHLEAAFPDTETTAPAQPFDWTPIAGVCAEVWLAGMGVFFVHRSYQAGKFHRLLCKSESEPSLEQMALYRETARAMGITRPPRLSVSSAACTPLLESRLHPRIWLPAMDFSQRELRMILTHELNHYRCGDLWLKGGVLLANGLHWFNPAVWLLSREMDQLCETSCDAAVAGGMEREERKEYGRVILRVLSQSVEQRERAALTFCGSSGRKNMEKRLNGIMESKKATRRTVLIIAAIVAVLGLAGTGVGIALAPKAPEGPALPSEEGTRNEDAASIGTAFAEGVGYDQVSKELYLTTPETLPGEMKMNIQVSGVVPMGDSGMNMTVHAFEEESANRSWEFGRRYTYPLEAEDFEMEIYFVLTDDQGIVLHDNTVVVSPADSKPDSGSASGPQGEPAGKSQEKFEAALASLSNGEGKAEGLSWPLRGSAVLTAPFTAQHTGIDIQAAQDSDILAAHNGTVVYAGFAGDYGMTVLVDRGDGISTFYAHCSALRVEAGDSVGTGDVIAAVGATGRATGSHLHLTCLQNGSVAVAVSFPELEIQSE